jgi:hypothetical protein
MWMLREAYRKVHALRNTFLRKEPGLLGSYQRDCSQTIHNNPPLNITLRNPATPHGLLTQSIVAFEEGVSWFSEIKAGSRI